MRHLKKEVVSNIKLPVFPLAVTVVAAVGYFQHNAVGIIYEQGIGNDTACEPVEYSQRPISCFSIAYQGNMIDVGKGMRKANDGIGTSSRFDEVVAYKITFQTQP